MDITWDGAGNAQITAWRDGVSTSISAAVTHGQDQNQTGEQTQIRLVIGEYAYTINGAPYTSDAPPFLDGSRTMVPLRIIAEGLGAEVNWDGENQIVHILLDGEHLIVPIGVLLPGWDAPAMIDNLRGRTFVPVRFVSEALGATVEWDGNARAVYIFRD